MRILFSAVTLALWSLYVWLFDPLHIEDQLLTDMGGFFYWLQGAVISILVGLILAWIWRDISKSG